MTAPAPRRAALRPTELVALYDAGCSVCRQARRWVESHRQLVPVRFVAAGSNDARRRFPQLDVGSTLAEITVVTDAGAVLRGDRAWTAILWALADTRPRALRLARGRGTWRLRGAMGATDLVRRLTGRPTSAPPASIGNHWPPPRIAPSAPCESCTG